MKSIILVLAAMFTFSAHAGRVIEHQVKENETAWFLSQLYYGSGLKYTEILENNKMSMPSDLKTGQVIKVINPSFDSTQPNFNERYKRLAQQRAEKLKNIPLQVPGESQDSEKSPLPVGQKKESKLPFVRTDDGKLSPAQRAIEELKKTMRLSESVD